MRNQAGNKTARRRDASSVSLFPFLAVLICTMGVLILLLVIFTHQARLQAAREMESDRAAEKEQKSQQNESSPQRIEELRKLREEAARRLAEIRLQLGIIEDHSRKLAENYTRLKETKKQLEQSRADGRRREQIEAELAETRANIARIEAEIETVRNEAARLGNSHRPVIPYDGPSGTLRIPICIECRGDAIVLQPEGIVLTEKDFDGPLGPENPLAAALRAAREHILTTMGSNLSDAEVKRIEPYPLLLVRPAGTLSYNCARQAIKSWGPDFGYELIEAEWKIAYPSPDAALAQAMQQAVDSARALQLRLAAAAPKHYPQNSIEGPTQSQRYSTASRGGVSAYRGPMRESSYRPPGERQAEQLASGDGFTAAGNGNGNTTGNVAGNGDKGGYAGGGAGSSVAANKSEIGGSGRGNNSGDSLLGSGAAESSSGDSLLASGGGNATANGPELNGQSGSTGGGHAGGQSGGGVAGNSGNPLTAGQGGAGNFGFGEQNVGQQSANMQYNLGDSALANSQTAASQGIVANNANNSATAPPTEGMREEPLRPGEWRPSDPRHRPTKLDRSGPVDEKNQPRHKPNSLAERRGKNWGLPDSASRSTPLPRPISVECHGDRLVVVPERGLGGRQEVTLDGPTVESVDEFVSAVRLYMDKSWGMAGNRMYWKPILKIDVAPGAENRFEDLKNLLDDSGLEVVRRGENGK